MNCQGLPEDDILYLQELLEQSLKIKVNKYQKPENKGTDKGYYFQIAVKKDVKRFFKYISKAPSFKAGKKVFKWKFSALKYHDYKKEFIINS